VVVSVALISVGLVGASAMFTHAITSLSYARDKRAATQRAGEVLEAVRTTDFDALKTSMESGSGYILLASEPDPGGTGAGGGELCAPVDGSEEPPPDLEVDVQTTLTPFPDSSSASRILCTVAADWDGEGGSAGRVEMATVVSRH
jgi:hypothetical protein